MFRSFYLETGIEETYDYVAATGAWRKSEVRHEFDTTYGQKTKTTDLGDVSTGDDDTCTTYAYARNTTTWHLDYVSEEITGDCAGNTLSGTRTSYDGLGLHAAPTAGNPTRVEQLTTGQTWETTSQATYDALGRPLTELDGLNFKTETTYTPSGASPTTSIKVKNPAEHEVVTNLTSAARRPPSSTRTPRPPPRSTTRSGGSPRSGCPVRPPPPHRTWSTSTAATGPRPTGC